MPQRPFDRDRAAKMLEVVACATRVSVADITRLGKHADHLAARRLAVYALRDHVGMSFPQIAEFMFGRTSRHSTVHGLYAARDVAKCEDFSKLIEIAERAATRA